MFVESTVYLVFYNIGYLGSIHEITNFMSFLMIGKKFSYKNPKSWILPGGPKNVTFFSAHNSFTEISVHFKLFARKLFLRMSIRTYIHSEMYLWGE
jgi:hypothetical protein